MPSLQSHLINLMLKQTVKKQFGKAGGDLSKVRDSVEARAAKAPIPRSVSVAPASDAPVKSEWVKPLSAEPAGTLLYLHGGGYVFGSPITHRAITTFFARRMPANVLVPDYRLAPEHPYPAAVDDAVACYDYLRDQGIAPEDIVVAGDSAGGGLALALLLALREQGKPLPASAALFSPYTDLAATGPSVKLNSKTCAMFTAEMIENAGAGYYGDNDPTHPLISPLYANLEGLPPLLIQVSASECLLDDSTRVARKAKKAGVDATLEIYEGMPHVWQLFHRFLPEAKAAAEKAAMFLRAEIAATDKPAASPQVAEKVA